MAGTVEQQDVARQALETACELLIDPSPENLDRCSVVLNNAISYLQTDGPPASRNRALRGSVYRVGRLLETAASYHRNWHRILRTMTASGYTAAGDLCAPAAPGRVSIKG